MSRGARRERAAVAANATAVVEAPADRPAPPAKHPWQLAISCALLLAWILFLANMAWG
jgi:hypothetical protein